MRTAFTPHYSLQWLRGAGPRRQHSLVMVGIMDQKVVDPICSKTYLASESSGSNRLTGSQVSRDVCLQVFEIGGGVVCRCLLKVCAVDSRQKPFNYSTGVAAQRSSFESRVSWQTILQTKSQVNIWKPKINK